MKPPGADTEPVPRHRLRGSWWNELDRLHAGVDGQPQLRSDEGPERLHRGGGNDALGIEGPGQIGETQAGGGFGGGMLTKFAGSGEHRGSLAPAGLIVGRC